VNYIQRNMVTCPTHPEKFTQCCCTVLRDYFTLNRSLHSHNTRNCYSLHVSSVQSTLGKRSIKCKGSMLWNNLPAPLREPMSINKFRKLIKSYVNTDSENWIFSCVQCISHVALLCWCFYRYLQNAHYFILVFGWVGGGMGGILPFSCFVSIDISVLM